MHIILEGPDGSGKSTLAAELSRVLRYDIVPGEGPEKYPGEILERIARNFALIEDFPDKSFIFDRHSCVSHIIYSAAGGRYHSEIPQNMIDRLYRNAVVIYCRSPDAANLSQHEPREGIDTDDHLKMISENHKTICRMYDEWALEHADFIYRMKQTDLANVIGYVIMRTIRSDLTINLPSRFDPVNDIREFHEKFGLAYDGPPRLLPGDMGRFRLKFMMEELDEYQEYQPPDDRYMPEGAALTFAMEKTFDALIDEVYVALGTSYLHGYDFREGWRRVHEANMKKQRVRNLADSKRNSEFDVIKPLGWKPPVLTDLVQTTEIDRAG